MTEIKYFNRWDVQGISVKDPGLVSYLNFQPVILPKTGARYAKGRFHKAKVTIVERFMNHIMVPGHKSKKHVQTSGPKTGKSQTVLGIMENVLTQVEQKTKQNPIKVLVQAVELAAPREEITVIEYGGARYPKAVECSPQRRIDMALRLMSTGAAQKSFGSNKPIVDALTDEIINAYNCSQQSVAIAKKFELERQADSSR
jgi:small subunit ribosomal protein S7